MAFRSGEEFLDFIGEALPSDRPATTNEIAAFLQRLKQRLDDAEMPPRQQGQYVRTTLQLETVLISKLVLDAEEAGAPPYDSGDDARETVRDWITRFWPV